MTGLNRAIQKYSPIVSGVFTPVLAKHTNKLNLVDTQEALTAQWGSR
jgi:hypothetical protein